MVLAALKSKFKSHDKTLSKDQTDISPSIDVNWINIQETTSLNRNGCMDTGCDKTLIDQDWLKV